MIKRIKNFIEKYKNVRDDDKEYYVDMFEKIILIASAVMLPIVVYIICVFNNEV